MPSDRVYVDGGASQSDGNFERTDDISSRALRLICMERGHWPGVRDKKIGSRLFELKRDTEENRNAIPGIVEEALQPLVNEGSIDEIEVLVDDIEGAANGAGAVGFIVTYRNLVTGDDASHEIPAPWTR